MPPLATTRLATKERHGDRRRIAHVDVQKPAPLIQMRGARARNPTMVVSRSEREFLRGYFGWWLIALGRMRDEKNRKEAELRRGLDLEETFIGNWGLVAVEVIFEAWKFWALLREHVQPSTPRGKARRTRNASHFSRRAKPRAPVATRAPGDSPPQSPQSEHGFEAALFHTSGDADIVVTADDFSGRIAAMLDYQNHQEGLGAAHRHQHARRTNVPSVAAVAHARRL